MTPLGGDPARQKFIDRLRSSGFPDADTVVHESLGRGQIKKTTYTGKAALLSLDDGAGSMTSIEMGPVSGLGSVFSSGTSKNVLSFSATAPAASLPPFKFNGKRFSDRAALPPELVDQIESLARRPGVRDIKLRTSPPKPGIRFDVRLGPHTDGGFTALRVSCEILLWLQTMRSG